MRAAYRSRNSQAKRQAAGQRTDLASDQNQFRRDHGAQRPHRWQRRKCRSAPGAIRRCRHDLSVTRRLRSGQSRRPCQLCLGGRTAAEEYSRCRNDLYVGAEAFDPLPEVHDPYTAPAVDIDGDYRPSLAVLPFRTLQAVRSDAYFAEGMVDDIVRMLGPEGSHRRVAQLDDGLRGRNARPPEDSRELNVSYVYGAAFAGPVNNCALPWNWSMPVRINRSGQTASMATWRISSTCKTALRCKLQA